MQEIRLLHDMGIKEIFFFDDNFNADIKRVEEICDEIAAQFPAVIAEVVSAGEAAWVAAGQAADLIVQSTPIGMKPEDPSVLPAGAFREGQWAFDLVYMYPRTAFSVSLNTVLNRTLPTPHT